MRKLFLALIALLLSSTLVHAAADDVSVRVEQPQSPTRDKEFKLTFVALDILDRPVVVKCYYKTPTAGGFSQFDSTKSLTAGGNSGSCQVTASHVSQQGTYQFYATAEAGGDTVTSTTANVDFNTSSPSTPTDYNRSQVGSCTQRITFKTADDGQTTKVEIYRSDSASFNLDSGTKIGEVGIGPNQNGEYNNNPPDCDKTYYYAIRAVDNAGNVSSPVGDAGTSFTSFSSTGTTPGAIPVSSSDVSAGSILGETTDDQAGNDQDSDADGEETKSQTSTSSGEVAGEETTAEANNSNTVRNIIIAVIIALLASAFFLRRRSKK